jgi:spore maturation protein CgeB
MKTLSILFVGQTAPGSRTIQRINALKSLGYSVDVVPTNPVGSTYEDTPSFIKRLRYRLRVPKDSVAAGKSILDKVNNSSYDVLWLERAVEIGPGVLKTVKKFRPGLRIIWYAEDDMNNSLHRTRQVEASMHLYDLWATTKSFNTLPIEIPRFGVKNILFVNNSYDETIHRPVQVSQQDKIKYGANVSFVGTYEKYRAQSLTYLAQQGISVRVWGNGWARVKDKLPGLVIEGRAVYDHEYVKVICASKINLCFLRKENRDLQTCRSIEIPACGGFMIHERNDEIISLFPENKGAVYFSDNEELFEQCKKWELNDRHRNYIATQGFERVSLGSFSHSKCLVKILDTALALGVS